MKANTLELRGLHFCYGSKVVLQGLNLSLDHGLHWMQGPNGCGKSTVLALASGALNPLLGQCTIEGACSVQQPLIYRQQVFACGPEPLAFDHLSPAQWAGFVRGLYPNFEPQRWREHAQALALDGVLDKPIGRLSSGTQGKVALAVALAVQTPVLLLDEPFNALDRQAKAHLVHSLGQGRRAAPQCVVLVSHEDPGLAALPHQVVQLPASLAAPHMGAEHEVQRGPQSPNQ